MVNISKIQDALQGIVGFKQPYNPDYAIVDGDNQQSLSGYFVTDNAYAKIEYIKDNQDYAGISDYDFNDLLRGIMNSSIADVVNQVFSEHDYTDSGFLFKNTNNRIETVTLINGFLAYRLKFGNKKNVSVRINSVISDLVNVPEEGIELILFHTSNLQTEVETVKIGNGRNTTNLDWVVDPTKYGEGDFFIGILNQSNVEAYKREFNDAAIMTQFNGLSFERVVFDGDLNNIAPLTDDIGLNFDISVYEDFTNLVITNKMLFARAIQLNCIIHCIQMYMASLRDNANNMQANILYEKMMIDLEGVATNRSIAVKGLRNKLVTEITYIRAEIEKLRMGFSKKGQIFISTMN